MSTFVIARLTFREASRRWILWVAILLGLVFLIVYGIGFNEIQKDLARQFGSRSVGSLQKNEIYNFILIAGLYAVNFLSILMTVLTSVSTIAGEIESGTIQTLASKPLPRWQILIGKWLGFAGMLVLYIMLMGGGVVLIVYTISGYVAPNVFLGLALMVADTLLILSVALAGGTAFSTLANGALVFGLYGVAFIGGWIEQFGAFLQNQTAVNIGILSSLIFPSEVLWRRAAFEMESPIVSALGVSPFSTNSVPSPAMIVYALFYTVLAIAFALRRFNRRDL
jgi:Cu-processing system permease protein